MEALKTYLKEIKKIPLLIAEEEIDLSKKIKKGNEQARKKMIQSNLRLVISIAKKYMYLGIPFLDLVEEGNLGLMKAVEKFNHKKGFRFSTYAAWWIRQTITRSISEQGKMIRVPVYMNELIAKWKKTKEALSQKLNCIPANEEIAKKMKIDDEKMDQINYWMSAKTSSLEAPIGDEDESHVMDLIEDDKTAAPDQEISRLMDKERVRSLLSIMSDREREILNSRFGIEKGKKQTLAAIARKLGVSRERIRQIEEEALKKLRSFVKERKEEI